MAMVESDDTKMVHVQFGKGRESTRPYMRERVLSVLEVMRRENKRVWESDNVLRDICAAIVKHGGTDWTEKTSDMATALQWFIGKEYAVGWTKGKRMVKFALKSNVSLVNDVPSWAYVKEDSRPDDSGHPPTMTVVRDDQGTAIGATATPHYSGYDPMPRIMDPPVAKLPILGAPKFPPGWNDLGTAVMKWIGRDEERAQEYEDWLTAMHKMFE